MHGGLLNPPGGCDEVMALMRAVGGVVRALYVGGATRLNGVKDGTGEEMAGFFKTIVRPRLRALKRGRQYPVLLPHFQISPAGLSALGAAPQPLSEEMARALRHCDGSRTLHEVASATRAHTQELFDAYDRGWLLFWHQRVDDTPPTGKPTSYIISPHIDDAVLGMGSWLCQQPRGSCMIVNVFSQSAWWRLPEDADAQRITEVRKMEESLVSRLTGARIEYLDLPEALLRGHTMEDVFDSKRNDHDRIIAGKLQRLLDARLAAAPEAQWFAPMGIGGHIDHVVACNCAMQSVVATMKQHGVMEFYEDLPYAAASHTQEKLDAQFPYALTEARRSPGSRGLWLKRKLELLRAYWTQLTPTRFNQIRQYARVAGEQRRYFHIGGTPPKMVQS